MFDKLLVKYQRQLKKLGNDLSELQALQWKTNLVDSAEEFLRAQIHIVDTEIHLKSPFDTKFVQAFRNTPDNPYVWHKEEKKYVANYSTHSLKIAYELLNKYFTEVVYCNETKIRLDYVKQFEQTVWNPVLKKVNGRFYVGAINEHLYHATKDIELNDDPKTLMLLSQYGVMISDEIFDDESFKTFAGTYNVVSDLNTMDILIEYFKLLDVEHVFTARDIIYNKQISDEIKAKLTKAGITYSPVNSSDNEGVLLKSTSSYGMPINNHKRIHKIVHLLNSRPVEIR